MLSGGWGVEGQAQNQVPKYLVSFNSHLVLLGTVSVLQLNEVTFQRSP